MTYARPCILVSLLFACTTDLGDVGSSTQAATEATTSGTTDGGSTGGGGQTSVLPSTSGTTEVATSDASTGAATGFLTMGDGGSDSSGGGTGTTAADTGNTVDDCSACADDEVCVADVAFVTTYHCEPMPAACLGVQFGCECASELCVTPFSSCYEVPGPSPALDCECPVC